MAKKKSAKPLTQAQMNNNLMKKKAIEKIVEHNRDYLKVDITMPLGNPALKKVHTNQFMWTTLPKNFALANWGIIAKALKIAESYPEGKELYDKIADFYEKQDTVGVDKKVVVLAFFGLS